MSITIIAAVAVCALTTPPQDCNNRTAVEVLFPATCAYEMVRCMEGDEYVYDEFTVPYVCYSETMGWLTSPGNLQRQINTDVEYVAVFCGRASSILNQFGTI